MKKFPLSASFAFTGLICLLSACASNPGSSTDAAPQKMASANCEVTEARIGSNMNHRSCAPAPVAPQPAAPAQPANSASAQ
jgi:hypothetical protein